MSFTPSSNFFFLAAHDPQLARLGLEAEQFFSRHPDLSLLRLRQLGERLAQRAAALTGVYFLVNDSQLDLLRRLEDRRVVPPEAAKLFHSLRRSGNEAAHEATGSHRQALLHLRLAWQLGVWFQRTFADAGFRPGPFLPPADPAVAEGIRERQIEDLFGQLAEMRRELAAQRDAAAAALAAAGEAEQRRAAAEEKARREAEDHAAALALAEETEQAKLALAAELERLQAQAQTAPSEALADLVSRARTAGEHISLDEAATRELIDEQLRAAGWEADTRLLRHASGTRPQKGRNLAIAEWPTASGPADYVLFAGLTPLAVVEAKREDRNIPGSIDQAKRYSRGFPEESASGGPWGTYRVPFLFATNGRTYPAPARKRKRGLVPRRPPAPEPPPRAHRVVYARGSGRPAQAGSRRRGRGAARGAPRGPAISLSLPGRSHPPRRGSPGKGAAQGSRRHGDRHREDPHRDRSRLPSAQDPPVQPHPLPGGPFRPRRSGRRQAQRAAGGEPPHSAADLRRQEVAGGTRG